MFLDGRTQLEYAFVDLVSSNVDHLLLIFVFLFLCERMQ